MSNKMKFDECLKHLLTTLNVRISQLSKSINVDSSLISHWVHGKRIPPYGSSYINSISEYLSKNIHNSYQESLLTTFLSNQYGDAPMPENMQARISVLLAEAQGYSMECRLLKNNILLENRTANAPSPTTDDPDTVNQNTLHDVFNINFTDISVKLIQGTEQILQASAQLLKQAHSLKSCKRQIIYITYTNTFNQPQSEHLFYAIQGGLLKLIKSGWEIIFLLRIDSNINRIINFIHYTLPIIKTGKTKIYYLKNYNVMMDRELYAIPDVGILTCFPTDISNLINCGFFLTDKISINSYINYFQVLLNNHSRNLIKFYGVLDKRKFYEDLLHTKSCVGKYLNYNCAFSMTLISELLYLKLLSKVELTNDDISQSINFYKEQKKTDLVNLANELYINIFFAETIEQVIYSRSLLLYTDTGVQRVLLEIPELIDYLQDIITFINSYENFQIAVIYHNSKNYNMQADMQILIKERKAVYLYAIDQNENTAETHLCIEEPTIVKAFMEYYSVLWENIPHINKDKKDYTSLLQSYIDTLKIEI